MFSLSRSTRRWLVALTAALAMVSAVTGTALAAPANGRTADTPMPLVVSSTCKPAYGEIMGNSGGAFEYFSYSYPGGSALQTITISTNTPDMDVNNATGVNLWLDGQEIGTFNALGAQPGQNSLTFSSDMQGQLLVQVYNYVDGADVHFSVSVAPASGS